jgi:hypothetical protein
VSTVCAPIRPTTGLGRGRADAEPRPVRGRRKRNWPCPQLVHDLLARAVDGRVPAHQCLGARRQVSAPNIDRWHEILPRLEEGPVSASVGARHSPSPHAQRFPAQLSGKCFNCLSLSHWVATCRLPRRCLRCCGFSHLARDCGWSKVAPNGGGQPCHSHAVCPSPS